MRKLILIFALMAISLNIDAQSTKRGDINGDGVVSIADVMQLIHIILYGDNTQVPSYQACPDNNHPHLIDLGLPSGTKWACCNVGATDPESSGNYYAWGEVLQKEDYGWENYLHADGSGSTCHDIGENICSTAYDVVTVKWGTQWQMPTSEQCVELLRQCSYEWTTFNGINGTRFTGSNGGSIFIPASGEFDDSYLFNRGSKGSYWTATQSPYAVSNAYFFYFGDGIATWANDSRCYGRTVRAVAGQTISPK